jgi:D-alanyl-D-alanine carboxypeptidase
MASFACDMRKRVSRGLLAVAALVSRPARAAVVVGSLLFGVGIVSAQAQIGSARYSSIVVDAGSGDVLEEVNADQLRHPASLAKMMTLYLTFEALRDRRIALDQLVPVSSYAASMEPTKLGLVPGARLTVEQAILGLITKSANDAAAAVGELLGGSEDRFAQMMTLRARALGMSHSTFMNASGLPNAEQWTTARDLAILSRRLINDFPGYYRYFSTPSFAWRRQVIFNHDNMLRTYPGADGLKTGYTESSGHNLVTSAVRGGVRLVGVVLGAASNPERDIHMASLLNQGFEQLDVPIARKPMQVASRMTLISTARASETPRPAPQARGAVWSVQVGSFAAESAARSAAVAARRDADAGEIRIEPVKLRHKTIWRAQVVGLTQSDALDACPGHHKGTCMIVPAEGRQVAGR